MELVKSVRGLAKKGLILGKRSVCTLKAAARSCPSQFPYEFSVAAIMRNESAYVEEWLKYHLLVGVDHFYIYDNGSTDNMPEILAPYVEKGIVTYREFPGVARQIPAYNDAIQNYRNESRYIAFIDTDEFLFPVRPDTNVPQTVKEILAQDPHAGGIAVNWRVFGSSHLEKKPEGGVLKNFVWRAAEDGKGNDCIKSIVDPRKVAFFNHVHYPLYNLGLYAIDENGKKVPAWSNPTNQITKLRINHYFTKSKEEWIKRRSQGRATTGNKSLNRTIEEFYQHDNNDIFDDSALRYANQL